MAENFQYGEQVSRAKVMGVLNGIRSQGSSVLDTLTAAIDDTLAGFNRRLLAMDGRVQRANRATSPNTAVQFVTSDFIDIDQGQSTATVRADVKSVSLRERAVPATAVVKTLRFSANVGTVERLDNAGTTFSVHTDQNNGQIPTGVFDVELTESLELTFLVFDVVPMPSQPVLTVEVSADQINYNAAQSVSFDGDRVTAWISPQPVRFVRLTVVPSHPDELSGTSFTFGVLDFTGSGHDYQLQADLVTKPITFAPRSANLKFVAPTVAGVTYFLSIGTAGSNPPFVEIKPGDTVVIPGSATVGGTIAPLSIGFVGTSWSDPIANTSLNNTFLALGTYVRPTTPNGFVYQVTIQGTTTTEPVSWPTTIGQTVVSGGVTFTTVKDGVLNHSYAATAYSWTLVVTGDDDGKNVTPAFGLSYQDPNIGKLTKRYVAINGSEMRYVANDGSMDVGRTFTISYETGPASIQVSLKVRLSTTDRSVTPVFTGASLQQA